MNKYPFFAVVMVLSVAATAVAEGRSPWSLSVGPAWRARVEVETRGSIVAPPPAARSTAKRDMSDPSNWTDAKRVDDPRAGTGGVPAGGKLWGVDDVRTETYGGAGSDYVVRSSDEERPLGLDLQAGYDFLQGANWSVGVGLRFAGYWKMTSTTRGAYDAGWTRTETWTDHYVFPEESPDAAFDPDPVYGRVEPNGSDLASSALDARGSGAVSTRFRGDLYQIGLGPRANWSPFAGVCDELDWLGVYGGVEALCNLAHGEFRANGVSASDTDCLLGFGGHVGLVGNVTDWLGVYGQVGYEWVDDTSVSAGGFKVETDYSSLVLSAGLICRF